MSKEWENVEPAPIEYFHGRLMQLFHEFRLSKTTSVSVEIGGLEMNNLIAKAKMETYEKYDNLNLKRVIHKEELEKVVEIPTSLLSPNIPEMGTPKICYKSNNPCEFNCSGLCRESF